MPFLVSSAGLMTVTFAVALAVRMVYLASFRSSPYFTVPIVDAEWHDAWAWGWAQGTWSMNGQAFFRAPLYPFWLSLIYRVFGHDLLAARVIQLILGAGTASALAGCGWRIGGRSMALWSGAIASLYGPLIFFDGELLIESLLLALSSWSLYFLLSRPSLRNLATGFFLLGWAAIARPTPLAVLPFVCVFAWSRIPGTARRRRTLLAGLTVLTLLPAAFVTAWNARAEGTFVFIASQGGVNFYSGNNPHATGKTLAVEELKGTQGSWADFVRTSREAAERESGRRLSSREESEYWSRKAWRWIRSSPLEATQLTIKKTFFLANSHELPNERDLYFERPFPLNALLWNAGWFSFPWGIVFPLAAAGVAMGLASRRDRQVTRFLAGWVALYALAMIPFFVCARFRVGLVPPVIVLCAFTLSQGRNLLKPVPLVAGLAAFLLANNGFFGVRLRDITQERARHGVVLIAAGRLQEGREVLRVVIDDGKRSPHPPSYLGEFAYHLGRTYLLEGNENEAAKCFKESLSLGCSTVRMLLEMGEALSKRDETRDAAVIAYRRSIDLSPENPQIYNRLGLIYQSAEQADSAIAVWKRGADRTHGSSALSFNLGLAYARRGEYETAIEVLDRAIATAPQDSTLQSLRLEIEREAREGSGVLRSE
jgi:tetratricopeptide (TPR) repeat protein